MKKILSVISLTLTIILICSFKINASITEPEVNSTEGSNNLKTLEDRLKELKEQRKIIEQIKLDQIEAKKLEKEQQSAEKNENKVKPKEENKVEPKVEEVKEKSNNEIPTIIVRLRGKHSSKYLCEYNFLVKTEKSEKVLERELITEYTQLLKRPSLKVRVNEVVNFEYSEEPEKLNIYIWGDEIESLKVKRGCIRVPDREGKIVVIAEGQYKNGYIKYAVVLDIRK